MSPEVKERFSTVGGISTVMGPEEYEAFILKENRKWGEVVRISGASSD